MQHGKAAQQTPSNETLRFTREELLRLRPRSAPLSPIEEEPAQANPEDKKPGPPPASSRHFRTR